MTNAKNILNRFYLVAALMFVFAIAVGFKLLDIQFVHGDKYKEMAHERVYKNFKIPANRGNLYDTNGSLLATSVPEYEIRFDAVTVSEEVFNKNVRPLAKKLSAILGRSVSHYENRLRRARQNKNRYLLVARNIEYSDYVKIKEFPIFKRGPYKGGFISDQRIVRELPFGQIGERTVGHGQAGLEGAYNEYLKGKDGHRLKQKIAKGQWKPISDANEVDPQEGLDVVSTIDVNIQDVVHHALLRQLEKYKADHGTAVVMETKTGKIKAMANLGRTSKGKYYEKRNYAIWETHEPGSTFKLMAMVAALEDNVIDTSTIIDTEGGKIRYYNQYVRDSHIGGYGKISAARAFEVSSNTAFSKIVTEGYKNNPEDFINRLDYMGLNQKIGLEIKGEGKPKIPHPGDEDWYGTTLPWMSFGYGVSLTPLQILMFYNAIANDGIAVKPRLIEEIRDRDKLIEHYDKTVVNNSVCSKETAKIAQTLMKNVVKRGTGSSIYTEDFSMSGKTGTCVTDYGVGKESGYVASFAGYFPSDQPKYSCIVVVSKPDKTIGFYGSQVAAPAFKEIAEKIHTRTPHTDTLQGLEPQNPITEKSYKSYFSLAQKYKTIMPKTVGLPAMDAVSLLENMGMQVNLDGSGEITGQSIAAGTKLNPNQSINLTSQ